MHFSLSSPVHLATKKRHERNDLSTFEKVFADCSLDRYIVQESKQITKMWKIFALANAIKYATLVPVHLYDVIQVRFDYHANVILSSFDIFLGAWIAEKCHKTRKTSLISLSN